MKDCVRNALCWLSVPLTRLVFLPPRHLIVACVRECSFAPLSSHLHEYDTKSTILISEGFVRLYDISEESGLIFSTINFSLP